MREKLQAAFALNIEEGLEWGGAVCVWQNGQEICSVCGGETGSGSAWQADTLVPIFSATKPAAAACLLQALLAEGKGPEMPVGDLWPAFPLPQLTIAELLSHQSGLASLAESAPLDDPEACRWAIENSTPLWAPPQHGYHPQTFGPMLDILMLELTGQRVCDFWEEQVRAPLKLDFYIGHFPEARSGSVAELRAPRLTNKLPEHEFYREYFDEKSSVHRAFHSIIGFDSPREMNSSAARQCGSPAKGGVASARGLAGFYQALLGLLPDSPFAPEVLSRMSSPCCQGPDLILRQHTAFTCGAMCEPAEFFPGGGFGHAGAGGSLGLCIPRTGLSFAYVMRGMELGFLPGKRVLRLLSCLHASPSRQNFSP